MGMKTVFENKNLIYNFLKQSLLNASIKNLSGKPVNYIWENFHPDFDKDSCPAIVLFKGQLSFLKTELDQFTIVYPVNFDLQLVTIDYSLKSLDEADLLTEDLMAKALEAIEESIESDEDIKSLLSRIEVQNIQYGPSEPIVNPYFSNLRALLVCELSKY